MDLQCGPWALELPDDWMQREQEGDPGAYFSSPDEDIGIYISLYNAAEGVEGRHVAETIREMHKDSFESFEGYSWDCVKADFEHGSTRALLLDMYASDKNYAVHTLVGYAASGLIKLTVHHYLATDEQQAQAISRRLFATLRSSD